MNSNIKIKKGQIEDYAVQKTGDQTIDGQKTFIVNPQVSHTENPNAVVNLEQMRAEMANAMPETTLDAVLSTGNTSVKNIILEKPSEANDLALSADGLEFANYGGAIDNLTLRWTTPGDGELFGTEIQLPKKSGTLAVIQDISSLGLQEVLNNNSSGTSETDIFIQRSGGNGSIQINDGQGVVIGGQAKGVILNGDSDGVKLGGSKIELNALSHFNAPASFNSPVLFQKFNYEEGSYETSAVISNESGTITITSSNETGIHYSADYSDNFTDRSLVDKAFVINNAVGNLQQTLDKGSQAALDGDFSLQKSMGGGSISIDDDGVMLNGQAKGITLNGGNDGVKLEGQKIELNTSPYFNATALFNAPVLFQQFNSEDGLYETSGVVNTVEGNVTITSSNETGIHYAADYSDNFTDRSLVDKEFVINNSGGNLQQTLDKGSEANFTSDLLLRKISTEEGIGNLGEIQITDRITLNNNGGEGITINGHNEPIKLYGLFDIGGYGHTIATKSSEIDGSHSSYLIIGDGNHYNTYNNYLKIGYKDSYTEANTKLKGTNLEIEANGTVKIKGAVLDISPSNVTFDVMGQFSIGSSSNEDFIGMTYGSDYSENYTDRSIPDVGYVNQVVKAASEVTLNVQNLLTGSTNIALTADKNINYFANTGTAAVWTLPAVFGNTSKRLILVNKGSGTITLNTNGTDPELFDGTESNQATLIPGATFNLYCDGVHWVALH